MPCSPHKTALAWASGFKLLARPIGLRPLVALDRLRPPSRPRRRAGVTHMHFEDRAAFAAIKR